MPKDDEIVFSDDDLDSDCSDDEEDQDGYDFDCIEDE